MATRPPRFSAIPSIPAAGLSDWQFNTLNAMKDNLELLIGAKTGPNSDLARAITKSQVGVQPVGNPALQQVTAQGTGFTINGVSVPSLEDYGKLLNNVQQLANDVAALRNTLNALINQLKG